MRLKSNAGVYPIFFLFASLGALAHAQASNDHFRTPARQYGTGYSIKMKLVRGEFSWVVPVWVKPDVKVSALDRSVMGLMGWTDPTFDFNEASLSGAVLNLKKFATAKTDWAYYPDFAKSCCAGVIGQDILKDYEVRFDPRPPAHLEWTKVAPKAPVRGAKRGVNSRFAADLSGVFSISSTRYHELDLTTLPYVLNESEQKLVFDQPAAVPQTHRLVPLFRFEILSTGRQVKVTSVSKDLVAAAAKVGIRPGVTVTLLNREPIGKLDRSELEQTLLGRRKPRITLTYNTKKEIDFDFKKNEFAPTEPLPRRSR